MTHAYARRTDPDTAVLAAQRVDAPTLECVVLQHLKRHGPSTTKEIAAATGIDRISISPRLRPLCTAGLVIDSGIRRDGCTVFELVQHESDDQSHTDVSGLLPIAHDATVTPFASENHADSECDSAQFGLRLETN